VNLDKMKTEEVGGEQKTLEATKALYGCQRTRVRMVGGAVWVGEWRDVCI
jgi:hypothetical protein